MSRAGVSLLGLLRRCVPPKAAALASAASPGYGTLLLQRSSRTAASFCGQRPPAAAAPLRRSGHLGFCTKTEVPSDEDYPPLPSYQPEPQPQPEPEKKELYVVMASGFPWSSTEQDLVDFFSECRIRDGVAGVHFTTNRTGRPTGRAIIEMEHEEDVSKALEKHRQYLGSRYVDVCELSNSDAETMLNTAAPAPTQVVHIRGLPFASTKEDIVEFFSGLEIEENGITIVTDHRGRNSGTAFVQFTSQQAAADALLRDRELIGQRYIEVFPSNVSEIIASSRGPNPGAAQHGFQPENPGGPASRAQHRTGFPHGSASTEHFVHMKGLPYQVSADAVLKFFAPLVLTKLVFECSPGGRFSGEAVAYFSCNEDAAFAMTKNRHYIGSRYIELYLNSESNPRRR